MRLEDAILKIADYGEVGRNVKKGVGILAGGLMDIAFPFLIPTQDVIEGPKSSARVAEARGLLGRAAGDKS